MTDKGINVSFTKNHSNIIMKDGTKFKMRKQGKLYYVKTIIAQESPSMEESEKRITPQLSKSLIEWHNLLAHCNMQDILNLEKMRAIKISDRPSFDCKSCIEGKMTESFSRNPDAKATSILELVHTDIAGPIDPVSKDGSKYCICFVDDYSGLISVYFFKSKSDPTRATERY